MLKLSTEAFNEIRLWMYRNARHLELTLWQYEFENGSKEAVISALSFYQNADGGFGNALEPDCWNPDSSPYTTLFAIRELEELNFTNIDHPIMQGIFKFLESGVHSSENGWLFSIPSNDGYPRAPWWTYSIEENKKESMGVSAGIIKFIFKFADKSSGLYKRASSIAEKLLAEIDAPDIYLSETGVDGYIKLKDIILQTGLTDKFDMEHISKTIKKLVNDSIERDVSKWQYHCKKPSSFISSPGSEFYEGNEEIMEKELDYIIDTRHKNGVWDIDWSWGEQYPKEFAVTENWWKAETAINPIKLLRNFDRIDNLN